MIPRATRFVHRHGPSSCLLDGKKGHSNGRVVLRSFSSAIDRIVENQIAEWLRNEGNRSLPHGKKLVTDPHEAPARSLGVGDDYVHSKILADNNVRPESVQRRVDLDAAWNRCARDIRERFSRSDGLSVDDFVTSCMANKNYEEAMETLNNMAKRVNDAIIDDSMRFGGRCPVRHARPFRLEERIREALGDSTEK